MTHLLLHCLQNQCRHYRYIVYYILYITTHIYSHVCCSDHSQNDNSCRVFIPCSAQQACIFLGDSNSTYKTFLCSSLFYFQFQFLLYAKLFYRIVVLADKVFAFFFSNQFAESKVPQPWLQTHQLSIIFMLQGILKNQKQTYLPFYPPKFTA